MNHGYLRLKRKFQDPMLVRLRRPDGKETLLAVEGEHIQRVMDLANGEFGDRSIQLGGPALPENK